MLCTMIQSALGNGPRNMICVTLSLHVVRVKQHTDMQKLHAFQKRATESDNSGHCLVCINKLYNILYRPFCAI